MILAVGWGRPEHLPFLKTECRDVLLLQHATKQKLHSVDAVRVVTTANHADHGYMPATAMFEMRGCPERRKRAKLTRNGSCVVLGLCSLDILLYVGDVPFVNKFVSECHLCYKGCST